MSQSFNYEEALLGLTTIVAWADGNNQNSEVDARVKMMFHENISTDVLKQFGEKYDSIDNHDEVYRLSIESLKTKSSDQKAKACAWMYQVALVGSATTEEELDHIKDNWETELADMGSIELRWIDKARNDLGVSLAQQKYELDKLPEIERV